MIFILNQFVRLVIFLSLTPLHLPKRIEKIQDILSEDHEYSGLIYVDIDGFDHDCNMDVRRLTRQELKFIVKRLQEKVDNGDYAVNPEDDSIQYLLTETRRCCETTLKAKWTDGTKATLYTSTGVKEAISFTFTCGVCGKRYFPNYMEQSNSSGDVVRTYSKLNSTGVFHVTRNTFFNVELLRCITIDIAITHVEFTNYCDSYNMKFNASTQKELKVRRLVDAYLLFHLAKRIDKFSFNVSRDGWRGIDTEAICYAYYPLLKDSIDNRWLHHMCSSPGCLRRLVIGDGDQKLFRNRCEAVGEKVLLERGELNPIRACGENPLPKESACSAHLNGESAQEPNPQDDIRRVTRQHAREMGIDVEELSTNSEGCRPKENITTNKNNRTVTCGMLFFFRDCFIRLGHVEMLTSESCTIIVMTLVDLFGKYPSQNIIRGLAFDRACEISPFLRNKGLNGNMILLFWSFISMVVDKFHVGGHKKPECRLEDPRCKYHPDHEANKDLWTDVNTEVAEQSFRELNKSKTTTRYMSRARRLVYFKIHDDEYNMILENRMKKRDSLLVSGSDVTYEESRRNAEDKTRPSEEFQKACEEFPSTSTDRNEWLKSLSNLFTLDEMSESVGDSSESVGDLSELVGDSTEQDELNTETPFVPSGQLQFEENGALYRCDVCGVSLTSNLELVEHLNEHINN